MRVNCSALSCLGGIGNTADGVLDWPPVSKECNEAWTLNADEVSEEVCEVALEANECERDWLIRGSEAEAAGLENEDQKP